MSILNDFDPYTILATQRAVTAKPAKVAKPVVQALAGLATLAASPAHIASWDTTDWQTFFDERAGVAEYDGGLSRPDAESMAYEACISHWLNKNPPAHSVMNACPQCSQPAETNAVAGKYGNGGHIWLHDKCHVPWLVRRRQEAVAALAATSIIQKESHV